MAKSKKSAAAKRKIPKSTRRKAPAPAAKPRKPLAPRRGVHDLGGLPGGPIDREPHASTPFEERVDALMMVLSGQLGLYKVDSLRRTIESMTQHEYRNLAYYEKWIVGIRRMLVEQGVLTDAEIDAKIAAIRDGLAGRAAA
jgi:hypothetical protein